MRIARSSPDLSRREVAGWFGLGLLLAVAVTWPLLPNLGTHVPGDLVDPLAESWELAWGGHALRTDPGNLWQGNVFHPAVDSYAFSDTLLGYAPLGLVGNGFRAAAARYGVAFLLAYALCFAAPALLARELGVRRAAAAVAGVAFAYAPWRVAHVGHLNVLSVGGIPLTAFLLLRGYARRRPLLVVAGWLAAAWQLSIGFAIGIWFCYAVAAGAVLLTLFWWRDGRARPPRRMVVASVIGVALFAAAALLLVRPYLRVVDRYPTARRTIESVDLFAPPPSGLLAAPEDSRLWGPLTKGVRDGLKWPPEMTLFPGLAAVVLGAVGVLATGGAASGRVRGVLAGAAVVATVLGFGTALWDGRWTYRPLYDVLPGWQAVRTPGRLVVFSSLALALAAALGAERLARAFPEAGRHLRDRGWSAGSGPGTLLAGVLAAVVLAEGLPDLDHPRVPKPPAGWPGATEPAVHLPAGFNHDSRYMFWSTSGFPRIANGNTSFLPPELGDLRTRLESFPDEASVAALRALGIHRVVVHRDALPGTGYARVLDRRWEHLGLTAEATGDLIVYTVP